MTGFVRVPKRWFVECFVCGRDADVYVQFEDDELATPSCFTCLDDTEALNAGWRIVETL